MTLVADQQNLKRQRIANSCLLCRKRKLKCSKTHPACDFCLSHGRKCEYIAGARPVIPEADLVSKLARLQERLTELEARRDELCPIDPTSSNNFVYIFTFGQAMFKNKYLNAVRSSFYESIPQAVRQQLFKEKRVASSFEIMKNDLRLRESKVFELIRPYVADEKYVWHLVHHFFESELYCAYSFLNRDTFYQNIRSFYISDLSTTSTRTKSEYNFLGILLLIMRISYISFFNCGLPQPKMPAISEEVFTMATLCLEEAIIPTQEIKLDGLRLVIMIHTYQKASPELIGPVTSQDRISLPSILQFASLLGIDREPEQLNPEAVYIRRMWYHILELDRLEFMYLGNSIRIFDERFTTQLPSVGRGATVHSAISRGLLERNKYNHYLEKLSRMVNNVRNPPTIKDLNEELLQLKLYRTDLKTIISMDSSTRGKRWEKTIQFMTMLDLLCVECMLSVQIFLYYDERAKTCKEELKNAIAHLIDASNEISELSYFFEPQRYPTYNLHKQFGYSHQLIPRMIQCLHRGGQVFYTIILKLCSQSQLQEETGSIMLNDEIIRIMHQNAHVLVQSWMNVSELYVYASRMCLILSYITERLYDSTFRLSPVYIQKLLEHGLSEPIDDDTKLLIKNKVLSLNSSEIPDHQPVENWSTRKSIDASFIDNPMFLNDFSMIEQLEILLSSQSFIGWASSTVYRE